MRPSAWNSVELVRIFCSSSWKGLFCAAGLLSPAAPQAGALQAPMGTNGHGMRLQNPFGPSAHVVLEVQDAPISLGVDEVGVCLMQQLLEGHRGLSCRAPPALAAKPLCPKP